MGQYANELYAQNCSLLCENKALRKTIDEYKSGKRYTTIQDSYARIISGYKHERIRLIKELAAAREETKQVRNIWFDQCDSDFESYQAELDKMAQRYSKLEKKYWETVWEYDKKTQDMEIKHAEEKNELESEIQKKEAIIQELTAQLAHAKALLDRDGTNTGTPTSQTPRGKKKVVPNGREKTGKPKGGQKGHKQSVLEPPAEEEVNDSVSYELPKGTECPGCGSSDLTYTGEYEDHFEYDVKITVVKRRHRYYLYMCQKCGLILSSSEGPDFRSKCRYGPNIQALALSLMNTVNAPMNKTALFLKGISGGEISPSDGYIAKLQPRASSLLEKFYADLRLRAVALSVLYWDDTVIFINTKRACFRFYGDETMAFYTAHLQKGLTGLLEDNVLPLLTTETNVMHDHNPINYNPKFQFQNLECDQHLERDAQKNTDDTRHEWSKDLKKHVASTIHDRNEAKKEGKKSFERKYITAFNTTLDEILKHGWQEYEADKERLQKYGAPFERALLVRLEKYRSNYFAWVEDFSLPTTNNLSERSLRSIKSKMKIAGQFESEAAAQHFAMIRSYRNLSKTWEKRVRSVTAVE